MCEGVGGGNPPFTAAATPRRDTPLKDENSLAADCLDLAKSLKLGGVAILIFISQRCNLLYFSRYNKCLITGESKASVSRHRSHICGA